METVRYRRLERNKMKLNEMIDTLSKNPEEQICIVLSDETEVPANFHITEVGRVNKKFIDCGGTIRESNTCLLQIWVACDFDHRLTTTKLAKILNMSLPLFEGEDLPVEFEYDNGTTSQWTLNNIIQTKQDKLLFILHDKHTACLAPDKCGVKGCC